ncbi:MAG: hypothetical protein QMD05_07260 [Candidatus Brocadiaceae bacterium]|nr:hypothetical protein [Candidatus Brocadiaceae bacterium]
MGKTLKDQSDYRQENAYGGTYLIEDKMLNGKRYRYCVFPSSHVVYKTIIDVANGWKEGKITLEEAYIELECLALPFERWLFEIIADLGMDPSYLENILEDHVNNNVRFIAFVHHGEERYHILRYI